MLPDVYAYKLNHAVCYNRLSRVVVCHFVFHSATLSKNGWTVCCLWSRLLLTSGTLHEIGFRPDPLTELPDFPCDHSATARQGNVDEPTYENKISVTTRQCWRRHYCFSNA